MQDKEGAARAHLQRTVMSTLCGVWIFVAWLLQAGLSAAWLGYLVFLLIGYAFWNAQHFGISAPWHGEFWLAHDDFHVFGVFADLCAFHYAIPAASDIAA